MAADIEIVTCLVTDEDARVFLMHRDDHDEWQFPGARPLNSKSDDPWLEQETPENTAVRLLDEALMITVDPHIVRHIGELTVPRGGVRMKAQLMEIPAYSGEPICLGYKNYDKGKFVDLRRRNIRNL